MKLHHHQLQFRDLLAQFWIANKSRELYPVLRMHATRQARVGSRLQFEILLAQLQIASKKRELYPVVCMHGAASKCWQRAHARVCPLDVDGACYDEWDQTTHCGPPALQLNSIKPNQ